MGKRDLTSISDLNASEVEAIYSLAARLKSALKAGRPHRELDGCVLSMIFEKPSLRTRMTFETGIYQLGGLGITQVSSEVGLGERESIYDVAKNLERWVQLIMIRTFEQSVVEELARCAGVPVINALTDLEHPCQALADLFTLREHKGELKGRTLAFIGDGNNICHSLLLLCTMLGVDIHVATPARYRPNAAIMERASAYAAATGAKVFLTDDPAAAVQGADAIYTDVWASMGQEEEAAERQKVFQPYQVNAALVAKAPAGVLIMHDLPAHRGEEITDEVIDSPNSIVFDQAENRLHVQKGVMVFLYKNIHS
jgi:ornithine carbamoyltransferase